MQENSQKQPIKLISLQEARKSFRSNSAQQSRDSSSTIFSQESTSNNSPKSINKKLLSNKCKINNSPTTIHNTSLNNNIHLIKKALAVNEAFKSPLKNHYEQKCLAYKTKKHLLLISEYELLKQSKNIADNKNFNRKSIRFFASQGLNRELFNNEALNQGELKVN